MRKYFSNIQKNNFKHSILVFLFLFLALVGVFGYGEEVGAQEALKGTCTATDAAAKPGTPPTVTPNVILLECNTLLKPSTPGSTTSWLQNGTTTPTTSTVPDTQGPLDKQQSPVQQAWTCNINPGTWFSGCILSFFNLFLVVIPSGILWIVTLFFNAAINIVIQSKMYNDPFIAGAWEVVRDLSNIFFILILLYIALKTVMSMGGHETKSMITSVIIMAILINFSLFFTKIVIDSSNILANIFYNKLDVTYIDKTTGKKVDRPNPDSSKDVAGTMYEKFNTMQLLSPDFVNQLQTISYAKVNGSTVTFWGTITRAAAFAVTGGISEFTAYNNQTVPVGPLLIIMLVSGSILLVASYALFTSGIFLIGRLIELWVLMIFAPFAFMSFAVPQLAHTEYIGWDSWSKKLISSAFVAPIFMFMMYLIFKIIESALFKGFSDIGGTSITQLLLSIILPGIIIIGLLLKAKDFAKKGSGQFGEMVMTAAKVGAGLAVGVATGGTAMTARATVGFVATKAAKNEAGFTRAKATIAAEKWDHNPAPIAVKGARPPIPAKQGLMENLGYKISLAQMRTGTVDHERHLHDEVKKAAGFENVPNKKLGVFEQKKLLETYESKNRGQIIKDIREGVDANGKDVVDRGGNKIPSQNEYEAANRARVISELKRDPLAFARHDTDAAGELTDQGRKTAETELRKGFDELLKNMVKDVAEIRWDHIKQGSEQKVSAYQRVLATSNTSSFDIRKLAELKTDKREGIPTKLAVGLTTAVAFGIRSGMKSAAVNGGTSQGNVLGDIGNIVAEALKGVKINISTGGGKDDHGHSPSAGAHAPSGH